MEKQREAGEGEGTATCYEAVSWTMFVPWTDNIETRINAEFENWLQQAKSEAYEEAAADVRKKRNELIAETDYLMCIDRIGIVEPDGGTFTSYRPDLDSVIQAATGAVSAYRQALRDVPEQEGFPYDVVWPVKP